MGWCSGTEVFDDQVKTILETDTSDQTKVALIIGIAQALEKADWDCQSDSMFYKNKLVQAAFKVLHPDWQFPEEKKHLYIWKDLDVADTPRFCFALATGYKEAIELIVKDYGKGPYKDLLISELNQATPFVAEDPVGYHIWTPKS